MVYSQHPDLPAPAGGPRRLSLIHIYCVITAPQDRFKGAVIAAIKAARDDGFAGREDFIVLTAGVPFNVKGTTNILRVAPCDERLISSVDPE